MGRPQIVMTRSFCQVWDPNVPETWPGKIGMIPNGYAICGFKIWAEKE
jgi:hypothetical protein